ncbi:MAG: ATP-binding protein [Acidobacteriota bacterium]
MYNEKKAMIIKERTHKLEEKLFETEAMMISWFIELRWIAFALALIFCLWGVYIFGVVKESTCRVPLTIFTVSIGISNGIFLYLSKKQISTRLQLFIQIISDLFILTGILHHSGGAENPLFMLYVFHVFIASILLSKSDAYKVTVMACVFFATLSILEYSHILPHYTLEVFPHYEDKHASHDPLYTFGILGVFIMVMFVSTLFATSLAENLRTQIKKQKEIASQLVQAAKMSAIGEIAGNIAHEINNPIGIIIMKTKTLLSDFRQHLSEKVISDIEKIDKHAARIATIITGLLSFARPSVNKKEPLDINKVIEESFNLIRSRVEIERISLKFDLEGNLPRIIGNFNELQQVIINIVNNAVDAMPDGGELMVRTSRSGYMNNQTTEDVEIEIADTGKGIPSEHKELIFTPFFTTKGKKGTGLGLTICDGIIRDHNGKIRIESTLGKGSRFHIFLPCARGEQVYTGEKN